LAELGSVVALEAVAVLVMVVPAAVPVFTFTASVKLAVAPEARLAAPQ